MGIRNYLKNHWGLILVYSLLSALICYLTVKEWRETRVKKGQEAAERVGWDLALKSYRRDVQYLQAELDDCKKERARHAQERDPSWNVSGTTTTQSHPPKQP
jgi:hypothetical protein